MIRGARAEMRATGASPMFGSAAGLSDALIIARQYDEAIAAADETLASQNFSTGSMLGPELSRLKGEAILGRDPSATPEAESCFRTAIAVARGQGSKWLELRATTSLARLLAKQGKRDEARAMLAEIYGWFTEGFDTTDLKDAKTLLDELGGGGE
jgi:predicted ATPase